MGLPVEAKGIERRILLIRGFRVMLDADLAALYGVTTFNLNKAVKRNLDRFPADFMFQLDPAEAEGLIFQTGISKRPGRGGSRYLPHAFTEQGVAMLSSVLRSPRAIHVNIAIMRTFVMVRQTLAIHKELAAKLHELERRIIGHDAQIANIFDAIKWLMTSPKEPPRKIGFHP
ncbi:MAG: ORF6N domain-containing protein [Elusimicrobia bacterium]|nr:ORF6N domain-containing protein [Elusimicrobiota bacterium]